MVGRGHAGFSDNPAWFCEGPMRGINKLTPLKVNKLKATGRYADGLGLYLEIRRPGDNAWTFRYSFGGKRRQLGLGPVHSVSLAEARERAREARQCILDGHDPIEERRAAAQAAKVERLKVMTFREAALQLLATPKLQAFKNHKHRQQWRSTLEKYAFPVLGDLPLQGIDSAMVLKAVAPVAKRVPETGSRLRGRIERVFEWAKGINLFVGDNPARWDALKDHLPSRPKATHHKAMLYADVPAFMATLRERENLSARALEFTILTATRTQEAIGARWSEIDLDSATWTIPASRMKAKRDHRVPLSHRAVEILRSLSKAHRGRIFSLSNMAMLELLRGVAGNGYTVHGFRSTFSDWARDRTGYARDVIEMALAHTIKDKSEAAYRRGDALDKRRRLMAEWARYCESVAGAADNVTPLRA
jgi:integrase